MAHHTLSLASPMGGEVAREAMAEAASTWLENMTKASVFVFEKNIWAILPYVRKCPSMAPKEGWFPGSHPRITMVRRE